MKMTKYIAVLLFPLTCATLLCPASEAAQLSATAAVERTDLFVGESFIFQIQVSGSENPDKPDLSHVSDFTVVFRGGQKNSSRSISIVNGKVTQDVREGYFFSYQLTPKRAGRLNIPSIKVFADGRSTRTKPLTITARKPVETDDFKLKLKLSKDHCFVGEPVTLTATWYIGKDVKNFNFTLPLLGDDSLQFANPEVDMKSGKKLYRIPLGDEEVIGEKGRGRIGQKRLCDNHIQKDPDPKGVWNRINRTCYRRLQCPCRIRETAQHVQ